MVVTGGSRPGLPAHLNGRLLEYLKHNYNLLLLAYFGVGELPFIPFYYDSETVRELMAQKYRRCYELSIQKNYTPAALIDLQNYEGRLLFISEENDAYWPSRDMTDILVDSCRDKNPAKHVVINLEGHYLLDYEESVEKIIGYLDQAQL